MVEALLIGVLGAAFLTIFYSGIRHGWPESYVSMSEAVDSYLSERLIRYAIFRILPVYAVAVFIAVTASNLNRSPGWTVAFMVLVHLGMTNLRALAELARNRRASSAWINLIIFHVAISVIVALTGWAAAISYTFWVNFVPSPEDSVIALWTALVAAVVAVFLQRMTLINRSDEDLLRRAKVDLGERLWEYIGKAASTQSCDADLMRAIVLAEVLQRPKWVRSLERLKGLVLRRGSYGVAQVGANRPISDEESIDMLCRAFGGYYPERTEYGYVSPDRLAAEIEAHNPDATFVDRVMTMYRLIQPITRWETTARGVDGRPVIEVREPMRKGREWRLEGTASVFEGNLLYATWRNGSKVATGSIQSTLGAPGRGDWSLTVPIEISAVALEEPLISEEGSANLEDRSVRIELG